MFVSDVKLGKSLVVDGAAMTLHSIDPDRKGCTVKWRGLRYRLVAGETALMVDEDKRIRFAMVRAAPYDYDEARLGVDAPRSVKIWKHTEEDDGQ